MVLLLNKVNGYIIYEACCKVYTYISFLPYLQPLARMGATVTGVDAVDKNIKIARLHAVCFYLNISVMHHQSVGFSLAWLMYSFLKDLSIPEIS